MNGEWQKHLCPDGQTRLFYLSFHDRSLRDSKGHPPSFYIPKSKASMRDQQAVEEVEKAREEARDIRQSFSRNRFGR